MSNNFEDDSFDDILADFDVSAVQTASAAVPSGSKKPKISSSSRSADGHISDSILANLTLPGVSEPQRILAPDVASAPSQSAGPEKPSTATAPFSTTNASKTNCVLVNPKQRGNPILKAISNVPWEFDDSIVPDYVVGVTAGILYLSLRYHQLNPDYIHNRLKQLGKRFELRVLLVQVDTKDPNNALKNLTQMCLLADLTLMLAWNADEAGKIVETYKMFESKPPDLIMARTQQYPHQKLVTALTNIKPVNKTDAMTLLQNYGSLEKIVTSSEDNLSMCSGLGPRKAKRLTSVFNEPFLKK